MNESKDNQIITQPLGPELGKVAGALFRRTKSFEMANDFANVAADSAAALTLMSLMETVDIDDMVEKTKMLHASALSQLNLPSKTATLEKILATAMTPCLRNPSDDSCETPLISNQSLVVIHEYLNHLSFARLVEHRPLDAVALAWASWRCRANVDAAVHLARAYLRLSQATLAKQVAAHALQYLVHRDSSNNGDTNNQRRPLMEVHMYAAYLEQVLSPSGNCPDEAWTPQRLPLAKLPPLVWPNWHARSLIELYETKTKGRAMRAKVDIPAGQILLVERALVRHEQQSGGDNTQADHADDDNSNNDDENERCATSLEDVMVERSLCDVTFRNICHQLYAGPSVPRTPTDNFDDLLQQWSDKEQPLLLPTIDAFRSDVPPPVEWPQAHGIVKFNAHGLNIESDQPHRVTELYPAMDMWNHDSDANCRYCKMSAKKAHAQDVALLLTKRPVAAGEELTISYGSDQTIVARHYGFDC